MKRKLKLRPYPKNVCWPCANPVRRVRDIGCNAVHEGRCGICGLKRCVSTPMDYGNPKFPGFKEPPKWVGFFD